MKKMFVHLLGISLVLITPSLFAFSGIVLNSKKNFNTDYENSYHDGNEIVNETTHYGYGNDVDHHSFSPANQPAAREFSNQAQFEEPSFTLSIDKKTVKIGEPITINVKSNARHSPITVYWRDGRESRWTPGGTTFLKTPSKAGTEVIKVVIKDANGNYSKAQKVHVTVLPKETNNSSPKEKEISEIRPTPKHKENLIANLPAKSPAVSKEQEGWFSGLWRWLTGN